MVSLQKMQSLAYSHRFALPLRFTTRMPSNNGAVMPRCHGFPEPTEPPLSQPKFGLIEKVRVCLPTPLQ